MVEGRVPQSSGQERFRVPQSSGQERFQVPCMVEGRVPQFSGQERFQVPCMMEGSPVPTRCTGATKTFPHHAGNLEPFLFTELRNTPSPYREPETIHV